VLGVLSRSTWHDIKETMPPSRYEVQVTAKQFNWEVTYPGPDGQFGTARRQDTGKRPERAGERSDSRQPALARRHPQLLCPGPAPEAGHAAGREIPQWFQATKTGRYEIPCAELCGFGHSGMLGHLTVHTAEDYAKWVQTQWPNAATAEAAAPGPLAAATGR
jgi:cytochrome c oxidase subunit 2